MRPADHPFGVSGEEDDGGDGNAVHLGAAEAAGGHPNAVGNVASRRSKLKPLPPPSPCPELNVEAPNFKARKALHDLKPFVLDNSTRLENDDPAETGVGGKVLPSPEPAELIAEQDGDGDGGLADHSSSPAGSWTFKQFVQGFGEEEHESALQAIYKRFRGEEKFGGCGLLSEDRAAATSALAAVAVVRANAPNAIVGEWLEHAKPKQFIGTDFELAKSIGPNFQKIEAMLRQRDSEGRDLIHTLALGVCRQMEELVKQEVGSVEELNGKFVEESEAKGEYLNVEASREVYDAGLAHRIGPLNDKDVVGAMYDEHTKQEDSKKDFVTTNYGVTTDPLKEWIAAAGEWTKEKRSWKLVSIFKIPQETKKIKAEHRRRAVCLEEFMKPPKDEEEGEKWKKEREESPKTWLDNLSPLEKARRCFYVAGMLEEEVLALRLWSGPMYVPYSAVLRNGEKGKYTNTLHAIDSAVTSLARIGFPEKVFRGIGVRAFRFEDFKRGVYVEMGAQSFTRDRSVAHKYSTWGDKGRASYILEVQEGEVDKGADISPFSYYPSESEKLYNPLAMMEVTAKRVQGSTLVLSMRVNVNARQGTLTEAKQQKFRQTMNIASNLGHELDLNDDVKKLQSESRLGDFQSVVSTLKDAQEKDRDAFNHDDAFQKAILTTVNSWKGASGHAALHAQVEDLLSKDAGDESVPEEIEAAEAELRQGRARLALPVLRRRLSDLRFMWSWGLREAWIAMFHVGLFVLAVASLPPVVLLKFLNVFVSLLSRVPVVGYGMQVLVASPLAALTSRASSFCGDAFFWMHFKVYDDFNDMWWLLVHRDVEIAGLVSAVEALEKEAGDVGDGSESGGPSVGGRLVGVACCLVVSLALPALLIAFAELQPWGPPVDGIHCLGAADTSPSYPTLMIVVGVLTLLCLCGAGLGTIQANDSGSWSINTAHYSFSVVLCCCGLPLLATAVVMWICMAGSPPECGIGMWVLGCVTLVTSVLASCGLFVTVKALGETAAARRTSAVNAVEEKEIKELEDKLRGLWRRGGFRAKQAADQEMIRKHILDALLRTSTRDLAHEHTCRRFLHAVQHLVEQCRVLPMRSTHVKYEKPYLFDVSYSAREEALEWLSGVEVLAEGYEHEDVERLLELFAIGTRQGETVLKSSELASWREARHMAALDVAHEYLDDYNLEQLATGKCRHLHPRTVSRAQAEFLAAFVCLYAPGPVTIQLPPPVVPIVLAGRTDRRVGVLTDSATAGAELHALLGNDTLHSHGSKDEAEGQAMGLKVDEEGKIGLKGKMSVEGLRVLAAGARWRYGRGASRAALLSWLRCQREQDEPAGVAHALGEVWAKASDGPSLAAVSDTQLQEWGVETADVRAEVLARIHRRFQVLVHIDGIRVDGNGGLGSADGGREAMRLLSELLPVLAPGLRELDCCSCKLGDEGVLALAEVVPQLPHLKCLAVIDNAFTGPGARGLRRAWQAARKPGVWLTAAGDDRYGLLLSTMDLLFFFCSRFWHGLSMFKTYKAVQRARGWPLKGLPAMAAEGRTKTVVELVQKYGANPDVKADRDTGGTALHAAARGGHAETVEALVQTCGANPNATDKETGGTSLHFAARGGHAATVEALVQTCGAKPELTDKRNMTALVLACAEGHEVVAEKLVAPTHAAGALELQGQGGCSALMFAEALGLASVVDKLHECGVTVASRPDLLFWRGELTSALRRFELNSFVTRALQFGKVSDGTDITMRSRQRCPMGSKGYYELEIIECDTYCPQYGFASASFQSVRGASGGRVGDDEHSWAVDGENQCAEHKGERKAYECKWKTGDVVGLACDLDGMQVLVSVNGSFAPPNGLVFELAPHAVHGGLFAAFSGRRGELRYNLGQAPFKYAAPSSEYVGFSQFADELGLAAEEGRTKTVVEMVQKSGANPNDADKYTGETALHAAARGGHAATVVALVQTCGAKPELTDKCGMTALALACLEGHEVVAEKLVAPTHAAGALELKDQRGCSALLLAEALGLASVVDKLHECGVTVASRPDLLFWRGKVTSALRLVELNSIVTRALQFGKVSDGTDITYITMRSRQQCPMGSKGYYELEILERDTFCPQYGFASASFQSVRGASGGRVGDDEHSWAVDGGYYQRARHKGEHKAYECIWKTGDVVGLACDLDGMQVLVSVNGSFAPPNGLVFELAPHAVHGGLFAAFTGRRGELRYNLGQAPFKYAAPSSEYVGFSQFSEA